VIAFAALCDAMDRAGVQVLAPLGDDGRHAIRLIDAAGARSLTVPVARGFDAASTMLCSSLALAAGLPGLAGEAPRLAARWPELVQLATQSVAGRRGSPADLPFKRASPASEADQDVSSPPPGATHPSCSASTTISSSCPPRT
jgi:hypothetical protein